MGDVRLTRTFGEAPEKVFEFITRHAHLMKWWGPEGLNVPEHEGFDFGRTGPWMTVMQNAEGQRFKVSGQVTHVDAPKSIGFTWAWHDENDKRGVESHVTIRIVPAQGGGTKFELHHVDLPADAAENHEQGWVSSLKKLEKLVK